MSHCWKSAAFASCITAFAAAAALQAQAQAQVVPAGPGFFYLGGEAGWTSLDASHASATIPVVGHRHDRETWDNGFDVGVRAGYQWGPWRVEEELRYQDNADRFLETSGGKGSYGAEALMTNAIYDPFPGWVVSPHVGGGIGPVHLGASLDVAGLGQVITGDDWVFGYQGIAGLRCNINPTLSLDVDYRYLATTTPQFHTGADFVDDNGLVHAPGVAVTSPYRSQSIIASLTYRFGAPPPIQPGPR